MSSVEICPDCSARLPVNSPAGLCPRCLLRLGAALAVDLDAGLGKPEANRAHEDPDKRIGPAWPTTSVLSQDGAIGAIPRVHLRDTSSEDTRLIRPTSRRDAQAHGPAVALPTDRRAGAGRDGRDLPGARPRPRPRSRRQGDPGGAPRSPRDGPPLRGGGPDRRPAPAPRDRPGPRAGAPPRRPAVHRDEAGPGPYSGGVARDAPGSR